MQKNKLAIFDLDGTLFDTKMVNYLAYNKALEKYNISIDYDYFCKNCNGKKYTQFMPLIHNFTEEELKDIHKNKKDLYSTYLDKAICNEHLFNIIDCIKNDYYIALVTTASKKNTYEILDKFNKKDVFDYILTQDDIKNPKPDPEGFLKAIEHYGIAKEDVIIFEDSNVGVEAAKKCTNNVYVIKGYN